ncbi:hypothetical protein FOCC_FOCC008677 [Frankliniella occidentalis]|nr:hypothetical protein FOCC_FOCC008677 [Frankliniella occidentalis]
MAVSRFAQTPAILTILAEHVTTVELGERMMLRVDRVDDGPNAIGEVLRVLLAATAEREGPGHYQLQPLVLDIVGIIAVLDTTWLGLDLRNPRLTNGSRSRSEPHLGDEAAAPGRVSTPDRCHAVTTTVSRTMSESSLVVEWEEEDDDELEPCGGVNGNGHQDQEKPRYVSECRMEPRCQPAGYSSTVLCRRDSTWRRFVEEVRFQKCLVPANTVTVRSSPGPPPPAAPPTSSTPPPPPPPRRYRTELDVWVSPPPRPECRQPIVLAVTATA